MARVVDSSNDKIEFLKPEGITFNRFYDVTEADKNISIAQCDVGLGVTTGYHSLTVQEIQLVLSGSGVVELDGEETEFKKGDRIIVPANIKQRHINKGTEPIELLCLCHPAYYDDVFTAHEKPIIDTAAADKAKGIIATLPYMGLETTECLKGKTAVVTGGNRGMGKEICRQLGRMGCRVMLTARSAASSAQAAEDLRGEGLDIVATAVDVGSDEGVSGLATVCDKELGGKVDILVNNAGANFDPNTNMSALQKATLSMQVNAFGPIRVTTELTPLLKKSGDGRVINVSSYIAASDYDYLAEDPDAPYPLFPHYRSSKQALNNWSREAALELKPDGISLNIVNPGWVKTSMGGGDAVDSVLDGIQVALYLSVTSDPPSGEFLQRFEKEKPQEGMLQICTRSW